MTQGRLIGYGTLLALAAPLLRTEGGSLPDVRLRRPVAAALLADGQTLAIANHRSGTVSVVDLPQGQVRDEIAVGASLADLAALPDRRHLLAVDEKKNELIALACDGSRLAVRARLAVGPYPVSVAVAADGNRAVVASLWSRRLEVIDITPLASSTNPITLRTLHTIRLPFAPRLQCALPGG